LAIDPLTEGIVYAGTDDGLYKSTDGAATWEPAFKPSGSAIIYAVVTDPAVSGTLYLSTIGANPSGLLKSVDGGASWFPANAGLPAVTRSLAVDPLDPDILYAGVECQPTGDPCVYKTTDGAASWQPMSDGFTGTIVSGLAIDPADTSTVYASTYFYLGVYRTSDGGASWTSFHDGLLNDSVQAIVFDSVTGAGVHMATFGSGVFDYQPG
jgi:photosystem II stability/assembly factor-like uncharacterized protein